MTSVATPPVDPREDRLFRAIKARADYLAKPVVGYDGAPALPGLDEQESARRAVSHLRPFLQANPEAKQSWKDYIDGKVDMPPKGWVPDYTSPEDVRQFRAEGMARARSENPWLAAGTDALNVVGSLGEGFTQGVTDMATGAANLIPGVTVPRVDVKASLRAFALNHVPWLKEHGKTFTTDEVRRELDATKDSANGLIQVAEMTGQGIGSMYSMIGTGGTGAIGKIATVTSAPFRGAMKLGDGIGKVLGKGTGMALTEKSGKLAKLISEGTGKIALSQAAGTVLGSAAGIAADKAIKAGTTQDPATGQERKATMGERAGQAGVGAAEGALFGLLGEVGKAAFRSMFKSPLSKLGVDEKNAVTVLADWAKQNKLFQVGRETSDAYSKRILNAYVEAGFPGAPRMYGRQILGRAMQGGIEGLGFSALDERFHRDLFDGAFQGDTQALKRALIAYGAGVFQTMAMHIPLKDIPRAQRRQDFTPTGEAPKPQEPVKPVEPKVDSLGASVDVFAADKKKTADLDWMDKAGKTPVGYDKPQGPPSNAAPVPDKAVGAALSPNLSRLGWETKDAGYITGFDSGQKIDPATLEPFAVAPKPPAPIDPTTGAVLGESGGLVPTSDPNWQSGQAGTAPLGGAGDAAPKRPQVDPTTGAVLGESGGEVPASDPNWRSEQAGRSSIGGDAQADPRGDIDPTTGVRMSPTQTHYLPGTKFGFEVDGDVARPTKALRDALGVPSELPVTELTQAIEGASVMSALVAKEQLPGTVISADGIVAVPDGDGVMRTVRLGEVLESPLSPTPTWVPAESFPARGKDPIPQEQAQVVEILTDIVNNRQDLPEHTRAMLSKAADVMDTVSLHNDEAVAETMGVVTDLVPVIAQGTPEQAAKAVQALGESLTVKHPEIALRDMAGPQDPVQKAPPRGDDNPVPLPTHRMVSSDSSLGSVVADHKANRNRGITSRLGLDGLDIELKALGTDVPGGASWAVKNADGEILASGAFRDANGRVTLDTAFVLPKHQRKGIYKAVLEFLADRYGVIHASTDQSKGSTATWESLGGVRDADGRFSLTRKIDDNPDGYGPAQVGMGVPIPREAGDIARVGGKGALEGASKAWSAYQASKTKRAEEVTNPTIGKIGREAASQERVYDARYNKAGVGDMLRLSTKVRKELEQVVTDKDGYQTTVYVVNRDAGAKEHFGAGPKLSEKARRGVELGDAIQLETGRVAEENKVEFLNAGEDGPQRFTTNERRKRHIRMATPEWIHAMDVQKGEVWDAMVRFHEINGGWTPERTAKHYNDVRTAMRRDATEYLRVHRSLPTRVPTKDGMVKIFEDTPVEHSVRLARTSSHVMSVKNTLARYPVEPKPGDREYMGNVEGSELPTDVQAQLSRVATDYGDAAADTVADMFRPLMGMSNNGRNSWMGEPGTAYNKVARVIVDLINLAKVSKLPLSFVKNMFEAAADAPFLTRQALMHGYGKVFQDFMGGKVNAVYRDLVSEGWVKDSAESTPLQGMDAVESFSLNLERAKSLILTPVTISQSVNEMVKAYAARERLQAMREGNGTTADLNALKLLEFDAETAMRMVDGKGTDLEYQQYKTAIIGALSGGKSLHGVFRSSMADNRGFNALVWYNSYFQTRARAMTALGSRVAEARGTEKVEASAQLFRMAAFTALSGLLGELASKFLKGEAGDYVRESTKDLGSASEATLKLLAGGLLGGVGTPVSETLGKLTSGESTEDVLGGSIARAIPLLGVVGDFTDLVRSTVLGANVPGYEGKSFAGKVSKYLQEFTPLASTLHRGLFGLSALAITEHDPALDAANRSLWRWMADNPDYAKGKFVSKEASAEFRSAMRKVVDRVMSGDTWTDEQLSDALLEAEMAAQDEADKAGEPVTIREIRNRVAKSLRARKVIPPKLPEAVQSSLEDHLGADHYQTLQDYDRVLEAMARHVSPPRRF